MNNQNRLQVCYYSVKQDLTLKESSGPGNRMLILSRVFVIYMEKNQKRKLR